MNGGDNKDRKERVKKPNNIIWIRKNIGSIIQNYNCDYYVFWKNDNVSREYSPISCNGKGFLPGVGKGGFACHYVLYFGDKVTDFCSTLS